MDAELIDRIYESAVNTNAWPNSLEGVLARIGAASGELIIFEKQDVPPRWRATPHSREALTAWVASGDWQRSLMNRMMRQAARTGFLVTYDIITPEDLASDPSPAYHRRIGLHQQLFTPIPLPTGEVAYFSFERLKEDGRFPDTAPDFLNGLLPHFSRAALISARLGLERARAATDALEALGLPAAVMSAGGRVRSANTHFSRRRDIFLDVAFGGLAIADPDANMLFQKALIEQAANSAAIRSIPVSGREGRPPLVIHIVPLKRSAQDIFASADLLIAATEAGSRNVAPDQTLLCALFDLTPAEARFAAHLAAGHTIAGTAALLGITQKTGRTYLERIFIKTGRHRQAALVALLKDIGRTPV
ncbi:MAG: LuxR family transcriptional regulator [Shinella sp.]|nr:MAG: LuxR family transcriptional regulator [Shinella sp.]